MLVVFDLDFTLWDAGGTWCDHTMPPYTKSNGYIKDAEGRNIYLYTDVKEILEDLARRDIALALASRTHSPENARTLMDMFSIRHYFQFEEIYPGSKVQHFEILQKHSGYSYSEMYFFDDEERNVREVGSMGVNTHLVLSGLDWSDVQKIDF